MQDKDVSARLAAAEVLSGLYNAIADHTQFDGLLQAMDDFIDADPEGLERGEADWKQLFRQHFSRAGQFLQGGDVDDRDSPIVFVDKQVVPAAIVNRRLDILAGNTLLTGLFGEACTSLEGMFSSPNDARRFNDLFRSNEDTSPVLVSLSLANLDAPIFVVASQAPILEISGQSGPLVVLKVAKATWNPDLVPLLEAAYGLTLAEIEVLEGLIEYGSVATVAEIRERSVRTVRTQLTHIFAKLGLTSQTELALFLATLTQLMTKEKRPSDETTGWLSAASHEIERCQFEVGDRTLAYVKYGDPNGVPVMLMHATTPPDMTPEFRQACAHAGVYVIGVHKPGAGGASSRPSQDGPEALADDYAAIMDAENLSQPIIAGHCSGGLYALAFTKAYPRRHSGIVLIDTGLPFSGRSELMKLPKSLRRTFIPARYLPEVLLVPHRIFAANFKRSSAGEARVVDYFFQDNPVDQNLTRTDRKYYEITRQIIEYSFQDVDRLVADVCRWARDWSDLLDHNSEAQMVFAHGGENRLFEADRIKAFCSSNAHASLIVSEGMGQLQVYQNPAVFTDAVARLRT